MNFAGITVDPFASTCVTKSESFESQLRMAWNTIRISVAPHTIQADTQYSVTRLKLSDFPPFTSFGHFNLGLDLEEFIET